MLPPDRRDEIEEAEEAEDGEELEDDPTDPSHPDYDLSTSAPYAGYEPPPKPWYTRRLVLILVAVVVITGLVGPYLRNLL